MTKSKKYEIFIYGIKSLLITCAILMSYEKAVYSEEELPLMPESVWGRIDFVISSLTNAFNINLIIFFFGVISCYVMLSVWNKKHKWTKKNIINILSGIMALLQCASLSVYFTESFMLMYSGFTQILKTIIILLGFYFIYQLFFQLFYSILESHEDIKASNWRVWKICRKLSFLMIFIIIFTALGIHVIIKFPGAMTADNWGQLTQYYGMYPMYLHWPPFHTCLLGYLVKLGESFGSRSWGLFSYVIMQWIIMSMILAYSIYALKIIKCKKWIRIIILGIYCISPFFTAYVGVVEKDVLYALFVLLFIIEVYFFIFESLLFEKYWYHYILFVLGATFTVLFRNNGKYIIYPTLVILFGYYLYRWKNERKNQVIGVLMLLLPFLLANGINMGLIKSHEILPGSKGEALSLPFQQTARYICQYDDEISDNEWDVLNTIFRDASEISERYDPILSDRVKELFIQDTSRDNMNAYFKLWYHQFLHHPLVYVEATVAQNYPLICIDIGNNTYFRDFHMAGEDRIAFTEIKELEGAKDFIIEWYKFFSSIPVIGLLNDLAFYVAVMLVILIYTITIKNYKFLIVMFPIVLSLLIVIAAPAIMGFTRYAFPVIYSVPFLFGCAENRKYKNDPERINVL